ncbi:MAG: hypothetical protein HY275_06165 [Gemmatimonadetes bacterium]|nr:hypothetical protein [Gemmatimonadota bacterium]
MMVRVAREAWARSPWMAGIAVVHAALLLPLAAGMALDPVQVLGVSRWLKPAKFAASIAIYLGTLAWYAPVLGDSRSRRVAYQAIGIAMIVEQVVIVTQAARGTTSHYNVATRLDGALFQLMGIWIAINTVAVAWCGWLAWRNARASGDAHALSVALGLGLLLAGSAVGGMLIAHNAHTVGAPDGGPGLVNHFAGRRVMIAACATWLGVTALALWQALAGHPLVAS